MKTIENFKQECTSCQNLFDVESMEADSADNKFCKECFAELKPVMDADYKEMVEKGEIEV